MERERRLGAQIAAFRRARGLTQEQLAEMVGVSAPAVSKWETDSTCPDIALLCPLARALETNVDTLLQFEEELPEKERMDRINQIVEITRKEGAEEGERALRELLRRYPNSIPLKFNGAVVYDMFWMIHPAAEEAVKKRWQERKRELLLQVRNGCGSAYWQGATIQLAAQAAADGELDRAEALLKELPEQAPDPTMTWASLYLKREEPEKALEITQKRLYSLVWQVQTCLSLLMNTKLPLEREALLYVCQAYRSMEEIFRAGAGMGDGLFFHVYLELGMKEEALACLTRYIDVLTGPMILPDERLFSPGLPLQRSGMASGPELRRMLLQGLEEESLCDPIREEPAFLAAAAKLRASLL